MTENEKVQILMKEYETLRAEIMQRSNNRFQFITILGGLGAFALIKGDLALLARIVAVVIATAVAFSVWLWTGHLIVACARRVSEIEAQVNALAGEDLLKWESVRMRRGLLNRLDSRSLERMSRDSPSK